MGAIVPADPEHIALAARKLKAGELVAFPTETVYGLGGDATNDRAIAAIYAAKGRPSFNPLIVHVPDLAAAAAHAEMPALAVKLAEAFWPGPLTLVLKRRKDCRLSLLLSAGLESVALRVPAHPIAQALLRASERPIAGPSANPSGRISPTNARHVAEGLGDKVSLILDGGPCAVGIESTVLSLIGREPEILRPGGVTPEAIADIVGGKVALISSAGSGEEEGSLGPQASPGRLVSHYAPNAKVRLDAKDVRPGEALLAFGSNVPKTAPDGDFYRNLSPGGDLTEAAANLFVMLRALDQPGVAAIAIMPIPETGLGLAINDRLRRAAAPRDV